MCVHLNNFSVFVPHIFLMCSLISFSNRQCDFNLVGVHENSSKHTCSYYMSLGLASPWCSDIAATRDLCPYNMRLVLESLHPLIQRNSNKRQVPTRACICLSVDILILSTLGGEWSLTHMTSLLGPSGSCWLSSSLSLSKLLTKITPLFKVTCNALEKKARRPSLGPRLLQFL